MLIFVFSILFCALHSSSVSANLSPDDIRTCLPKRQILRYANTHKPVPWSELESTPIHYGAWQSSTVFSLVTMILMREYLGLPCHLYPPLNESVFQHDVYWGKYINRTDRNYWDTWQEWFENGKVHIFPSVTEYQITKFDPINIYRQYFNGVNELTGLFIPMYMNDEVQSKDYRMLHDPSIQNKVAHALKRQNPSILANSPYYAISKNTVDFLKFHNLSDTWNVTYYDYRALAEICQQLYNNRDYFIILTSNPDDIFAILNDKSQGRKLEHVFGPDNPSGTTNDPCVKRGECFLPQAPFYYLFSNKFYNGDANLNWDTKSNNQSILWSTMKLFWNLTIPRTDINDMMRSYANGRDAFDVACDWIKTHNDTLYNYITMPHVLETEIWSFSQVFTLFMLVVSAALTTYLFTGLVMINLNKERTMVKRMSVQLSSIWLFGCILVSISTGLQIMERRKETCIMNTFLDNIGMCIVVMIPAIKGYRISRIFNEDNVDNLDLTNCVLLKYVAGAIGLEVLLCTLYTFAVLQNDVTQMRDKNDSSVVVKNCTPDSNPAFTVSLIVTKGIYLFFLGKYGWATRKAWKEYRETIWLLFASFFTALMYLSLLGFWLFDDLGMITQNVWVVNAYLMAFTLPTSYLLWIYLERNEEYEFDARLVDDYVNMKEGEETRTMNGSPFTSSPMFNGSPTLNSISSPSLQAMAKAESWRLRSGKKF